MHVILVEASGAEFDGNRNHGHYMINQCLNQCCDLFYQIYIQTALVAFCDDKFCLSDNTFCDDKFCLSDNKKKELDSKDCIVDNGNHNQMMEAYGLYKTEACLNQIH